MREPDASLRVRLCLSLSLPLCQCVAVSVLVGCRSFPLRTTAYHCVHRICIRTCAARVCVSVFVCVFVFVEGEDVDVDGVGTQRCAVSDTLYS